MNKNEKNLFLELCRVDSSDKKTLERLLPEYATPNVLGELFFNRMAAIAYGNIKSQGLQGLVNREFRNSLLNAYLQNIERNISYYECLDTLTDILHEHHGKYAMLKGALLCGRYPDGYRTSNDVDLLVAAENVSAIGDTLKNAGFCQGNIRNGVFVPAKRSEIITSKMTRGETVPYILEVKMPLMRYLEVDINLSLDYKPGNSDIINSLLERSESVRINDSRITTLSRSDFIIHLCQHLYKEASTMPWIKMRRDMTMYKYCDIYTMVNHMTAKQIINFYLRADELGMLDICSCVILWVNDLLGLENTFAVNIAADNLYGNENILHEVISPGEHKKYEYTEHDIVKRFFAKDRASLLWEVST